MSQPRRSTSAPWIAAGIAGVVLVALLAAYFFALRPDEDDVAGALSGVESTAMTAAGTEAANVLSYRRAHFAADYQRALAGATGSLASDLRSEKSVTLKTITDGKFDMSATVTHTALESPEGKSGHAYTVLVTLNGYRSTSPNQPVQSQLAVTVQQIKGKWLVSQIQNVGVGG
jgi:hypothetical protein